ncbi:MAG: hypothetical protein NT014_05830 [Candidatus Omnitrophica bacterium]|nr:hypothetical protein [Candidatus Omnitrophota bacterium]
MAKLITEKIAIFQICLIGFLYIIMGVWRIILSSSGITTYFSGSIILAWEIYLFIFGLTSIYIGLNIIILREWARRWGIILAILNIITVPIIDITYMLACIKLASIPHAPLTINPSPVGAVVNVLLISLMKCGVYAYFVYFLRLSKGGYIYMKRILSQKDYQELKCSIEG